MNAFEFLSRAYRLELQVQSKSQQIADLRAMASHVSAFMGNESVSHTRDVTGMQNTVAKIVEEAGGQVVGIGAVIEKGFQGGSDRLREMGYRVESLAVIERIDDGVITIAKR